VPDKRLDVCGEIRPVAFRESLSPLRLEGLTDRVDHLFAPLERRPILTGPRHVDGRHESLLNPSCPLGSLPARSGHEDDLPEVLPGFEDAMGLAHFG